MKASRNYIESLHPPIFLETPPDFSVTSALVFKISFTNLSTALFYMAEVNWGWE
jgi:hypothetical protein